MSINETVTRLYQGAENSTVGWLLGKLLNNLSDGFVAAYMASAELGLNSERIKHHLIFTEELLYEAQRRGVTSPALSRLVHQLIAKANKAEDVLDELQYFVIQDQIDGTRYAVPVLGNGLSGLARNCLHAIPYTMGNCLKFLHCLPMQDDGADSSAVSNNTSDATNPGNGSDAPVDRLPFNRIAMSKKIRSAIGELNTVCESVSRLLPHGDRATGIPSNNTTATYTLNRSPVGPVSSQDTLYGRKDIFEKTVNDITGDRFLCETLSVLPVVGPAGIGKTTFVQHLYNDRRIEQHFTVRIWVCVSIGFDVLKLTQQILSCIEGNNNANQATNLGQIQVSIAQRLKYKSFLIVFDDIWECNSQDWETLLAPLMKGETKGNMVLVTTRFPSKANIVKTTELIPLKGLEPDDFFRLFEAFIFVGRNSEDYDLSDVAKMIAIKLKGSPLAAKTVGRLLRKELSREHWMRVFERAEWQNHKASDDIMASIKISYEYLPFNLKKCFSYFSLFPEDYKFKNLEITYFWIAIGIIDKDENYMEELVDNGFLEKEIDHLSNQYYIMHDLLHEFSRSVSSQECLNIDASVRFRADSIPESVCHLSITMEDKCDGNFMGEMIKLRSKIDIVNLRVLMIFREYGETIDEILKDTFKDIKGLRVLYIKVKSPEFFPCNFSKLIHLRCLNITLARVRSGLTLPSMLSRFYHLILLDLRVNHGSVKLPKDISRLINLRHLLSNQELHSNVAEVGKMKCLQELKEFHVRKESVGFELSELGKLTELGGELKICNLEKVKTKEEAMETKLVSKSDLKKLELHWGRKHYRQVSGALDGTTALSDVLDGFQPHPNLLSLVIEDQGCSAGPRWLCGDISIQMLKSLHLGGVSWVGLPPFEQLLHLESLTLIHVFGLVQIRPRCGGVRDKSFMHLKKIVLEFLPNFTEWVVAPDFHLYSRLETIICRNCPNLCVLPFLQNRSAGSYTNLSRLEICSCPKLFLPPITQASTATHVDVSASSSRSMIDTEHELYSTGCCSAVQAGSKIPWVQAQLPKLTSLRKLFIEKEPNFVSLPNLTSLTSLELVDCYNLTVGGFNPLIAAVSLKEVNVYNFNMRDGPNNPRSVAADLLSELAVAIRGKLLLPSVGCFQLEDLCVDSISGVLAAPVCSLFAATLKILSFCFDRQVESFTKEEENALQLLTSLQILSFSHCTGLPSLPQGLYSLSSLYGLSVDECPQIQSLPKWEGLPTSLKHLSVIGCPEIRTLAVPASLRNLTVIECSPELNEQAKKLQATCSDWLEVKLNF